MELIKEIHKKSIKNDAFFMDLVQQKINVSITAKRLFFTSSSLVPATEAFKFQLPFIAPLPFSNYHPEFCLSNNCMDLCLPDRAILWF